MITRRTKVQLLVFAIITLLGVSYVGARYAQLDRVFVDDSYEVTAQFPDSGGIFAGGEVTYRGVGIGQVSKMELTKSGVDVVMSIDKNYDDIPSDALAVVGNRSAVGEQYVELQPQRDDGPFLRDGSVIEQKNTEIPIATDKLLTDISGTVSSVDQQALRTTIDELGTAFAGTGDDLQRIIDTGGDFIQTADANFDLTTNLIRDSNTVLTTQVESESAIRNFSSQLSKFTDVLAGSDPDLRRLIDNGGPAANQLRTFLEDNQVELGDLLNNLVTTGQITVEHLDGVKQLLVLYPYVVEGGFTVVAKSPDTGLYDAHFGLIITSQPVCHQGYQGTDTRPPQDGENRPMNTDARCTEPASESNARGAQNIPLNRAAPGYDAPVVGSYDEQTGAFAWGDPAERSALGGEQDDQAAALAPTGSVAPPTLGEESWKWLFLQPLTSGRE
ncbi:MCE family protein [Nocardioides flavescens]|uniref:MCE family protein n=1 Tax=Nocardioides flavescens TaxID=2691959 RepID=A0A6L7EWQ5_9ACTN|nr:MCE family protein [Nocardioides flavescens]